MTCSTTSGEAKSMIETKRLLLEANLRGRVDCEAIWAEACRSSI
jgi:hypothetical protein